MCLFRFELLVCASVAPTVATTILGGEAWNGVWERRGLSLQCHPLLLAVLLAIITGAKTAAEPTRGMKEKITLFMTDTKERDGLA